MDRVEKARDMGLTTREQEVWQLLGRGCSNKEIANALDIAPRTAEVHVISVLRKTGARNRTVAGLLYHGVELES